MWCVMMIDDVYLLTQYVDSRDEGVVSDDGWSCVPALALRRYEGRGRDALRVLAVVASRLRGRESSDWGCLMQPGGKMVKEKEE